MKPQLALGDRDKLNERGMRLGVRKSWTKIDWPNRRGTVRRITKRSEAHVQWDGRKSVDVLPVVILEHCRSPSSQDVQWRISILCEQNSRIALIIDGANLNATAKTLGLVIDYKRLRAFYYTAIIRTMSTCRSAL